MTIDVHLTRTPRGDTTSVTLFPDEATAREHIIDLVRALGPDRIADIHGRIAAWDYQYSGPSDEARDYDRAELDMTLDAALAETGEDPVGFFPLTIPAHELPALIQRTGVEVRRG